MTVAQVRALLAALPDDAPLCFCTGTDAGPLVEITQVDLVAAAVDGDHFLPTFDEAASGVFKEAVVVYDQSQCARP